VQGSWATVSNSCTPDPATCSPSTQIRTLSCQEDYIGAITENRISSCATPYTEPVWGNWMVTQDTCVKSPTNVTNMSSPLNPVSPIAPAMQETVVQQQEQPAMDMQSIPATPAPTATTTTQGQGASARLWDCVEPRDFKQAYADSADSVERCTNISAGVTV
jgi:hypothetical protein